MSQNGVLAFQLSQPLFARQQVALTRKGLSPVLADLTTLVSNRALTQAQFAFHLRDGPAAGICQPKGFQFEFSDIGLPVFTHDGVPLLR